MFNHYNEKSEENLHIIHLHNEQFPYRRMGGVGAGNECQDENNEAIRGDRLNDLIKRNPSLKKVSAFTKSLPYRTKDIEGPNATKEHLDKALDDEELFVKAAAARNDNATKEHLDKASNDEELFVRRAAAGNKNATKEHLDKANSYLNN